ncbi:hypothetical protein Tco_0692586 [Tanacetum coccineum]
MQDIVEANGSRKRWYPADLREIFGEHMSTIIEEPTFKLELSQGIFQLSTKMSGGVRGVIENIKEVVIEITKRPLRVRLRSTQPVVSNSQLHMPRKFSSRTNSSLQQLLELLSFSAICSLIRARYVYSLLPLI